MPTPVDPVAPNPGDGSERQEIPALSVTATPLTETGAVRAVERLIADGATHTVVGHNLHSVTLYHSDPAFAAFYDDASIVLLDGAPVAKLWARGRGVRAGEYRVGSTDWISRIGAVDGLQRVAVLGADAASNSGAVARLRELLPHARIEGMPGAAWTDAREQEAAEWLGRFAPQLVLVGLGMPLQEQVISRLSAVCPPAVYCAVGGAIDQLAGRQRLAPRWIGRLGLEWAWRLAFHPRRVAYRVFVEPWKLAGLLRKRARTEGAASTAVDPVADATPPRVVAVVVSFNRRELLEKTLHGIASGEQVPEAVVVVDNASTDGSAQFVRDGDWGLNIDLVALQTNVGGAGGFTVGIEKALLDHDADLVWVMDDDTEPLPETLSEAVHTWMAYDPVPARRPAVVASTVLWSDGREHPMNSMRDRFLAPSAQRQKAERAGARNIRSASFVSCILSADAIRRSGLPISDYFIWVDDFEYTMRLARRGGAIQVPTSRAMHHTKKFAGFDTDPGPRFYNEVRNRVWTYTRTRALAPWELVVYTGSTIRFWTRTVVRSADRRALLGHLRRGLRDSLRAPRPNAVVLDGIYPLRDVRR